MKSLRAKPLALALTLATLLGAGVVQAQTKDEQIARMSSLQAQIDALKPQRTPESTQQLSALQSEFAQISASMGGDVPCGVGASQAGVTGPRAIPTAPAGCTPTTTNFTQSTPVAIPTGPAVVTSTVVVSGAGPYLWDLDVTTFITHTFAADLDVTITSPAGTVVTLTTDNGAGNDNVFNGTVWDDDANPGGTVPYTTNNGLVTDHAYVNLTLASPLAPEEALGAFVGEDPNGTWTITVSDDLAGDGGSLDSFSLAVTTFPNAVIPDAPVTVAQTTPVAIPTGPGVVTSTLNFSGLTNRICRARLTSNITHTFAADIDATLTSPAGTVITLTTDNGAGNDNVFNGTVWDDDANPAGVVPYTTNNGVATDHAYVNLTTATPLVAEESMSAFLGEDGNGTWTLTVSDDLAGDGGSIDSWSVELTTCTCSQADLAMTLTDTPDPVNAGSNLSYTATSTNNGPTGADNVQISLPMPAGTTFVSATPTPGGVCTTPAVGGNGTISCTWAGTTASGNSQNVAVVVGVPSGATGSLSATATTSSPTLDPTPGNNSATATTTITSSANLAVTLTASATAVAVNVPVTFAASAQNLGPSDAQNVVLTVTLSPDFRYSGHTPSAGATCTTPQVGLSGVISCTWAGTTTVGATRTLDVTAYSNAPGTSSIQASTSSATTDPVSANNTVSVSVLVGDLVEDIPVMSKQGLLLLGLLLTLIGYSVLQRRD
ncbi:MAG: proprotein convertase P-domain-containing protein [Lysobacterales bacterium]